MENTIQSSNTLENNTHSTEGNKVCYGVKDIILNLYKTTGISSFGNEYAISAVDFKAFDEDHIDIFFTRTWTNGIIEDVVICLKWDGQFSFDEGKILNEFFDPGFTIEEEEPVDHVTQDDHSKEEPVVEKVDYLGYSIEKFEVNNVTLWRFVVGYCQIGGCDLVYRTFETIKDAEREIFELTEVGFVPKYNGVCSNCRAETYGDQN